MLGSAHLVNRSTEVAADVVTVINERAIREQVTRGVAKSGPHIQRNGFNFETTFLCRQRFSDKRSTSLLGAVGHHFEHPSLVEVIERSEIIMPFEKTLFINANLLHLRGVAPLQAPRDSSFHNRLRAIPGKAKEPARGLGALGRFEHFNRESLEHEGKAGVLASPRNRRRLDTTFRTVAPGNRGLDDGFKVHGIEVAPASQRSMVTQGAGLSAIGTLHFFGPVFDLDNNP